MHFFLEHPVYYVDIQQSSDKTVLLVGFPLLRFTLVKVLPVGFKTDPPV